VGREPHDHLHGVARHPGEFSARDAAVDVRQAAARSAVAGGVWRQRDLRFEVDAAWSRGNRRAESRGWSLSHLGIGGAARWNTGLIASPDWMRDTPGMRVSTSSMKRW